MVKAEQLSRRRLQVQPPASPGRERGETVGVIEQNASQGTSSIYTLGMCVCVCVCVCVSLWLERLYINAVHSIFIMGSKGISSIGNVT